ncbi:hypothetical protein ACQVQF_09950 [Bacillus cereus]
MENDQEYHQLPFLIEKYSKLFTELIGLNFEFFLQEGLNEGEFTLQGKGNFLITTKDYSTKVLSPLMESAVQTMQAYNESFDIVSNKLLLGFTEDTCLNLVFPDYHELSVDEQYRKLLFINDLKEISGKAYETKPVNLGILLLRDKSSLAAILEYFSFDYIPSNTHKNIKELLDLEKPLLKLIDNDSLILVVDEDYLVIGFLRKKENAVGIKQAIEAHYDMKNIHELNGYILSYLSKLAKKMNNGSDLTESHKLIKSLKKHLASQDDEPIDEIGLNKLVKLWIEGLKNLPNYLEEKRNSLVEFNNLIQNFDYIYIQNRTVHWSGNFSFQLIFSNNKWNVKHFGILTAFIFEYIYDYYEIIAQAIYKNDLIISSIEPIIKSINKVVVALRNLTSRNEGALLIILNDEYAKNIPNALNKTGSREYKNIIQISDSGDTINIENCDSSLIELLSSVDGSIIINRNLDILTFGEITDNHVDEDISSEHSDSYGGRTKAAIFASNYGLAIKVSEDGDIELYENKKRILKL